LYKLQSVLYFAGNSCGKSLFMDHTQSIDRKIDEVWKKVDEMNPQLMSDWMKCFSGVKYTEAKRKCKQEMKNTVTDREYQSNPGRNFLLRMISCNTSLHGYRYLR